MFVELMPLLAGRTVMITVARENDKMLRVNVIPKKARDDENPALTTPLSYTGTPEELDAELGKHLASYGESHTQLGTPSPRRKLRWKQRPKLPRRKPGRRLPSGVRKEQRSQLPVVTLSRWRQGRLRGSRQ
jgi:PRTRC genetic system protein E